MVGGKPRRGGGGGGGGERTKRTGSGMEQGDWGGFDFGQKDRGLLDLGITE